MGSHTLVIRILVIASGKIASTRNPFIHACLSRLGGGYDNPHCIYQGTSKLEPFYAVLHHGTQAYPSPADRILGQVQIPM